MASNVIGAAAYHGNDKMLQYLLDRVDLGFLDVKSIETADRFASKAGFFKPEMHNLTPLQLAIVSPHSNIDVIKTLFGKDANQFVREDGTNNTIVHLAAKHCTDQEALKYIVKNTKVEIFARNSEGDTALTICQQLENTAAQEIIEECMGLLDDTGKRTDELMAELMGQDEKNEKAKQKKKEKKQRSKL